MKEHPRTKEGVIRMLWLGLYYVLLTLSVLSWYWSIVSLGSFPIAPINGVVFIVSICYNNNNLWVQYRLTRRSPRPIAVWRLYSPAADFLLVKWFPRLIISQQINQVKNRYILKIIDTQSTSDLHVALCRDPREKEAETREKDAEPDRNKTEVNPPPPTYTSFFKLKSDHYIIM